MTKQTSAGYGAARVLVAFGLLWAPVAGAGVPHRWVDERGGIHYTDAPQPNRPEALAPMSHRIRRMRTRARQKAAAAERAERSRRDRILWESYSSVSDIERTRDRRLKAVDGAIGLAEHRVERVRGQIERYDRLLADLPEGNEHRAEMERHRADARERLERRRAELERFQARRMRMEARFAREIECFRELMADRE